MGLCRTSLGLLGEAIEAFQKAIRMDKSLVEAYINLGQASKEVSPSLAPASYIMQVLRCLLLG